MGPVPPPGVAGPGHPTRRGPDGGVPWGWRTPTVRLSLSPLPFCLAPYFSPQVPCWRGSPSPAPMEGRAGKWLEPLLFAVREVPQASTGFSPFELLYGRQPRGVLDVLRETWEEGPSESKNEIQHVLDLRTKLHTLGQLSMENLLQAQDKQSRLYNRGARLRNFTPGDKVLVLLPTSSSKLLAKWQGPFEVTRQVGDLNYEVVRTDRSGALSDLSPQPP